MFQKILTSARVMGVEPLHLHLQTALWQAEFHQVPQPAKHTEDISDLVCNLTIKT